MSQPNCQLEFDTETLQEAISEEYRFVVEDPREDYHFHTGRPLARKLDYPEDWPVFVPLEATGDQARGQRSPSPLQSPVNWRAVKGEKKR